MPATTTRTASSATSDRCSHLRADALYPGHTTLCHHHLSHQMRGIPDGNSIAADILSSVGNFQSASAINVALGKLFIHQITGRISRQDALALAYTCQLLLQTLKMVKSELRECGYDQWWREETSCILSGPSDLDEITSPTLLPTAEAPLHPPALTTDPVPAVTTVITAAPPMPPPPPPTSSCSAGLQAALSSPSPSTPAPAPPRTAPSTAPSQSTPPSASVNSAQTPPCALRQPPKSAAPPATPSLPADIAAVGLSLVTAGSRTSSA